MNVNKTIIATAAILFTASAQASDSLQQFTDGNPDSDNSRHIYMDVTAMQPSVGADLDRYQGIGRGNPDLFKGSIGSSTEHQDAPDIYGPFGASPDLSY